MDDDDDDDDAGGYKTAERAVYWTALSYTDDLNIRLTLLIYQSGYHWWFLTNATIILALFYCIAYPRRNRAGSPNRKLLCSEPSLESGNGLYRPSHLFYFLENDEGTLVYRSLPPNLTPLESPLDSHKGYNLVATLQHRNSRSLPDKLGAIKPLNKRQVQSHTDKSLLSDREWKRDGEMGD